MVARLLAATLMLLTTSQSVFADVVVTRNHKRYAGTLANRAVFAKNPTGANSVSLIMDRDGADSLSVQRFPLSKIESVVLEDETDKRVFDVVTLHRLQSFKAKPPRRSRVSPPTDTSAIVFSPTSTHTTVKGTVKPTRRKGVPSLPETSAVVSGPRSARAPGKGTSMLSLQFGQGQGDFVDVPLYAYPYYGPNAIGFLHPSDEVPRDQLQFGAEYWYLLSEDYALTGALGVGLYGRKERLANSNLSGQDSIVLAGIASTGLTYRSSGTKFRIGCDRVGNRGKRFVWFVGPGLEYWSGRTKVSELESPRVTRFGFNGRVGGTMMLNSRVGITGRIGHTFGRASAEDRGGKTTWLTGTWEAMWGLTFAFRTVPTQGS